MNRRRFLATVPTAGIAVTFATHPGVLLAHHGWSSFDESRPIYLEGRVKSTKWQNPHVEIVVTVPDSLALPPGLARRVPPAQTQRVDGTKVLQAAALPKARGDWTLELSPLNRVENWKVPQPRPGDTVAAVAYTFRNEALYEGRHFARVEYLIIGEAMYGLRSNPA